MMIYVLSFNDNECFSAYTSFERAKSVLWENYCEEIDKDNAWAAASGRPSGI